MTVKSNSHWCIYTSIYVKNVIAGNQLRVKCGTVVVALDVVDTEILPFVTITISIHVSIPLRSTNILTEVASRNFLRGVMLGKEKPEIRVAAPFFFKRQIDGYATKALELIFLPQNLKAQIVGFISIRIQIDAILALESIDEGYLLGDHIEFVEIV